MARGREEVSRRAGRAALGTYQLAVRVRAKAFSMLCSGAFASFGAQSVLQPPIRLGGAHRIAVGAGVFVGAGAWLQVLPGPDGDGFIEIGDGTSLAGGCVLSSAAEVRLGRRVLLRATSTSPITATRSPTGAGPSSIRGSSTSRR